jgi:tRNA(fMet)-specific endonuclease VapC
MIRLLLDTDHVTLQERGHPAVVAHLQRHAPETLGVSIVTVQESLRGRLAALQRKLPSALVVQAYENLQGAVSFFLSVNIVPFTAACEAKFQDLRSLRRHIGTLDLRIAATALVQNLTLLTRNHKDFSRVPGLRIEDWSVG